MDQLSWLVYLYQEQNIYWNQTPSSMPPCTMNPVLDKTCTWKESKCDIVAVLIDNQVMGLIPKSVNRTVSFFRWLTVIMHSVRQLLRLNHEVGLSDEVPWVQLQVLWPVFDDIHRLNYLKNLCYSIIIWEISNWLSDCNWQWNCYIIIFVCMWLSAAIRITHVAIWDSSVWSRWSPETDFWI